MKRAQLNFAVDAVIAVAFLICAVTGMLFLLPPGALRALGLGMPGMLGISFRTWHWLHDWSGVVATVGVLVHAALHYRWIVTMTRRTFGSNKAPARRGARAPSRAPAEPGRAAPRPTAPAGYSTYRVDTARRNDRSRITRRRFLAGAAAGLAVAFLGGALLPRLGAVAADVLPEGNDTKTSGGATGSSAGSGGSAGSSGTGSGGSADSGVGGSGSATQSGSGTAVLVSVDTSSCIGCGRCLNVCPAGVFAWDASGSHAVASNAARCIRCHRCLETCPASAITVNG